MSITVRELLQLPHLRLTLTAGAAGLDLAGQLGAQLRPAQSVGVARPGRVPGRPTSPASAPGRQPRSGSSNGSPRRASSSLGIGVGMACPRCPRGPPGEPTSWPSRWSPSPTACRSRRGPSRRRRQRPGGGPRPGPGGRLHQVCGRRRSSPGARGRRCSPLVGEELGVRLSLLHRRPGCRCSVTEKARRSPRRWWPATRPTGTRSPACSA